MPAPDIKLKLGRISSRSGLRIEEWWVVEKLNTVGDPTSFREIACFRSEGFANIFSRMHEASSGQTCRVVSALFLTDGHDFGYRLKETGGLNDEKVQRDCLIKETRQKLSDDELYLLELPRRENTEPE